MERTHFPDSSRANLASPNRRIAYLIADDYLDFLDLYVPLWGEKGSFRWQGTEFVVNPTSGSFDGMIAHQSVRELSRTYTFNCPPTKTALIVHEPPDIVTLPDDYTRQFYSVVSQDKRIQCEHPLITYPGSGWFVELTLDQLQAFEPAPKEAKISAVVSAKADTVGHRKRFQFMLELKEHFGARLDWWGRGVNDLDEPKYTALKDYQYHIALENGNWPHYWTEKLADCFAADCVPIYWGAPNIGDYFDPNSMLHVDVENSGAAIAAIERALDENFFEKTAALRANGRRDVITKYHPYQRFLDVLANLPDSEPAPVTIRPFGSFQPTLRRRIANKLKRMMK